MQHLTLRSGRKRHPAAPLAALVVAFVLAVVSGCERSSTRAARAQEASRVAAVFETPEPYSARTLDSTAFDRFFTQHPEYRGDSARMADFYARRNMQFAWIVRDSLTASADAFIALAGIQGYGADERRPGCDSCAVKSELELTARFFEFAARNYGGYFKQDLRDLDWFIPRAKRDIAQLMDSLAAGTMDLSAYEPLHPQYQLLRDALQRLSAFADATWPALALPDRKKKLEIGDSVQVIADIRARLQQLGDLALAAPAPDGAAAIDSATVRDSTALEDSVTAGGGAALFDSTLMHAVARFQSRHGLDADGVIGPAFLREVNVSPAERMRTLTLNMERMRWLPEKQPPNALLVNIPAFRLHVFEGDSEAFNMRIVVGATATHTVIFADTLTEVVLSPTWTVPMSITRNEILPALRRNPGYLRANNMEVIGGTKALPVIRQKPGPNNALGRVKFLFPNRFNIYMHDTPARTLFAQEKRAFSHGCIRLAEPKRLADYLLRDDPEWPPSRIEQVMLSRRETTVRLKEPRPVFILYFTAWVDKDGVLNFRDDVYGHDKRLAEELFRD